MQVDAPAVQTPPAAKDLKRKSSPVDEAELPGDIASKQTKQRTDDARGVSVEQVQAATSLCAQVVEPADEEIAPVASLKPAAAAATAAKTSEAKSLIFDDVKVVKPVDDTAPSNRTLSAQEQLQRIRKKFNVQPSVISETKTASHSVTPVQKTVQSYMAPEQQPPPAQSLKQDKPETASNESPVASSSPVPATVESSPDKPAPAEPSHEASDTAGDSNTVDMQESQEDAADMQTEESLAKECTSAPTAPELSSPEAVADHSSNVVDASMGKKPPAASEQYEDVATPVAQLPIPPAKAPEATSTPTEETQSNNVAAAVNEVKVETTNMKASSSGSTEDEPHSATAASTNSASSVGDGSTASLLEAVKNINTTVSSFLPMVQKKEPVVEPANNKGKVRVKALEAAQASKAASESKKSSAAPVGIKEKLERARLNREQKEKDRQEQIRKRDEDRTKREADRKQQHEAEKIKKEEERKVRSQKTVAPKKETAPKKR